MTRIELSIATYFGVLRRDPSDLSRLDHLAQAVAIGNGTLPPEPAAPPKKAGRPAPAMIDVKRLWDGGVSRADIARKLECDWNTVAKMVRRIEAEKEDAA